jgi:flagellar basal-body rod protein FlgB
MWNGIFQNASVDILTETVKFSERRHQLLASNIANLDTPGYLTQDISVEGFQKAMQDKLEVRSKPSQPNSSSQVDGLSQEQAQENVHKVFENILYHDGNNVSLEQQVTEISKNQAMHSTAITILGHQLHQLKMAIGESVSV